MNEPRPWFKLDDSFLTRGSIELLADRFGAAGPLAIIALIAEANAAIGGGKRKDLDVVEWRYEFLGRRIRVDADTAQAIVHAAGELDIVKVLDEADGGRFKLRLLKWLDWNAKDPTATARQQRHRAQPD